MKGELNNKKALKQADCFMKLKNIQQLYINYKGQMSQ